MPDELIVKAFTFAYRAHKHSTRKGSSTPYIIHPLSVATTLMRYNASEELIAAALLHDVVEDENISLTEIEEKFGKNVCILVETVSEPKELIQNNIDRRKTWRKRKQHTIDSLHNAARDIKLLSCADKLSNISDTLRDYDKQGEELWKIFNAPKEEQEWYYRSLVDVFSSGKNSIKDTEILVEFKDKVEELFNRID
jgi:(p)ppGpp synthase/HD superfamily hydrolase